MTPQAGTTAPPASPPAPCAALACTPGQPMTLTAGYTVRLWTSRLPTTATAATDRSTPVVELLHDGRHAQWWVGRLGYGWAAKLTCLAGAAGPNCVVAAEVGSHAGVAEVVLLRNGALVGPATASVTFDSGTPSAADLDGDGQLDVIGVENDYTPSFATGHNYWTSYRLVGSALEQTGCLLMTTPTAPAPRTLLAGHCPVINQN